MWSGDTNLVALAMESKDDDDSDDSDFRPKGETNAEQADERVAKIKKARDRVDAPTPAAANQSGCASDDNWESKLTTAKMPKFLVISSLFLYIFRSGEIHLSQATLHVIRRHPILHSRHGANCTLHSSQEGGEEQASIPPPDPGTLTGSAASTVVSTLSPTVITTRHRFHVPAPSTRNLFFCL